MQIAVQHIDTVDDVHYIIHLTVDGQAEKFRTTVHNSKPRFVEAERDFWNRFWPTTPRLAANLLQLVLRLHAGQGLNYPIKFYIQEKPRDP